MTTLGKILAFVNLVFSVVTGALIVMVFVTRANWREGFEKEREARVALQSENASLEARIKTVTDMKDEEVRAEQSKVASLTKALADKTKEAEDTRSQLMVEMAQSKKHQAAAEASAVVVNSLRNEVAGLQSQLNSRLNEIVALQNEVKRNQDEAIKAQIAFNSANDRLQQMVEQIEDLARENVRLQNRGNYTANSPVNRTTTAIDRPNPPPEEIRGLVKATDAEHGLVTITLGSDAGLSRKNTLEVFRMEPPTYLGRIEIIDVRHNEAVGRLINGTNHGKRIQVGDQVASNILGSRN